MLPCPLSALSSLIHREESDLKSVPTHSLNNLGINAFCRHVISLLSSLAQFSPLLFLVVFFWAPDNRRFSVDTEEKCLRVGALRPLSKTHVQ